MTFASCQERRSRETDGTVLSFLQRGFSLKKQKQRYYSSKYRLTKKLRHRYISCKKTVAGGGVGGFGFGS